MSSRPIRDILDERVLTLQVASDALPHLGAPDVLGVAHDLSGFAEARAGREPVQRLLTRDFRIETLEELGDARNYLCWCDLQARLRGDEAGSASARRVLRHVIAGYDQARQLPDGRR